MISVIVGPNIPDSIPRNATGLAMLLYQADNHMNKWASAHLVIVYTYGGFGTRENSDIVKWYKAKTAGLEVLNIYAPKTLKEWLSWDEYRQVCAFSKFYAFRFGRDTDFPFKIHYINARHPNAYISCELGHMLRTIDRKASNAHFLNAIEQGCFTRRDYSISTWFDPKWIYYKWYLTYFPENLERTFVDDEMSMYHFATVYKKSPNPNSVYATSYYRLYNRVNNRVRVACKHWALCGMRLGVCRDVRVYISKLLWEMRLLVQPWIKPYYK